MEGPLNKSTPEKNGGVITVVEKKTTMLLTAWISTSKG